jgi:hypothetical protein
VDIFFAGSWLNEQDANDFFMYQRRFIWYSKPVKRIDRSVNVFFDAELETKEENDKYSRIKFHEKGNTR